MQQMRTPLQHGCPNHLVFVFLPPLPGRLRTACPVGPAGVGFNHQPAAPGPEALKLV